MVKHLRRAKVALDSEEDENHLGRNAQYFPAEIDSLCSSYVDSSGYCCSKAIGVNLPFGVPYLRRNVVRGSDASNASDFIRITNHLRRNVD
ncbi:hypothetical protein SUGI_0282510 [Cryptomeria japonica]|nr:hypothetical protein SUGI_0282510 [Cryptomeria japonica]